MRRAATLAVLCLGLVAQAGCGTDDVKEAVDPVAEAAEKTTAKGGALIEGKMTVRGTEYEVPMVLRGKLSFEQDRYDLTLDFPPEGIPGATQADMKAARREAGFPYRQIVESGEVGYISSSAILRPYEDKDWARIDFSEIDEEAGLDLAGASQFSESNPEAMLRFLKTTADARKVGTDTVRGVPTTRYAGTFDIRRYPEMVAPDKREAAERTVDVVVKAWGSPTHSVNVWVDADGIIRRQRVSFAITEAGERMKGTITMDLLDVGSPQDIALPDDGVVDVTDEVGEQLDG